MSNSDLSSSTYYDAIDTYLYNSNDDGELTLNINGYDTNIVAGDHIYLYWPNNIAAQNSTITKSLDSNVILHRKQAGTKFLELFITCLERFDMFLKQY